MRKNTKFHNYLGHKKKEKKTRKHTYTIKQKTKNHSYAHTKKIALDSPCTFTSQVKTKAQQAKPGLRMPQCLFINPDWMKTAGIKTQWFWQTLAMQNIAPAITNI